MKYFILKICVKKFHEVLWFQEYIQQSFLPLEFLPRFVRTDLAANLAAPFALFFKLTLLDISANKLELQVKYNSAWFVTSNSLKTIH